MRILRNVNPGVLPYLPLDMRSILPSQEFLITSIGSGQYMYFGVEYNLKINQTNLFDVNCNCIESSTNVDGLPISKSSRKCFWPILRKTEYGSVFLIAIWYDDTEY